MTKDVATVVAATLSAVLFVLIGTFAPINFELEANTTPARIVKKKVSVDTYIVRSALVRDDSPVSAHQPEAGTDIFLLEEERNEEGAVTKRKEIHTSNFWSAPESNPRKAVIRIYVLDDDGLVAEKREETIIQSTPMTNEEWAHQIKNR